MTTDTTPTLRVRTIPDLLAIVPRVLGFHPVESLAVLVIRDGRLALTARTDLAHCTPDHVAERLSPLWERFPGALFLAVAFSADAETAWAALDLLDASAPDRARPHLLHADGQQWFEAPNGRGRPYDISSSAAAAQATYEGLAPLASRRELEASVEPTATPRQVRRALRAVRKRGLVGDALVAEALRLVERADAGASTTTRVDAAVLALASHDLAFREAAILSTSRANARGRMELWLAVVQGTASSVAGNALVILAMASWLAGQGAMQVVAMEKAALVASDGDLLEFLDQVNRAVLSPESWEQLRAEWYEGVVAPRASGSASGSAHAAASEVVAEAG